MEGYIKTTVFEKETAFKFDLKAIGWMLRETNLNIQELVQALASNPYLSIPVVLYFGKKRAAELEGKAFEAPFDEVYDWIALEDDGILSAPIQKVAGVFIESAIATLPKSVQEKVKSIEKASLKKEQAAPNGKKSTGKKM